jgi:hypothetical protein
VLDNLASPRIRTISLFVTSVLLGMLAFGCGEPGKQYQFHPVKGVVLKGKTPQKGGTIRFTLPDDPNFVATSPIGEDGTFKLQTNTTNPARTVSGAPEGMYQVTVAMPAAAPNQTFPSLTAPEKYSVKAGDNDLTVKLP